MGSQRRKLLFTDLDEAVAECQRLLNSGYSPQGNWSLGQICRHMRLTMESNMDGYPKWMMILGYPLRPILRLFGLPRLLDGKSPKGIATAPRFVPPGDLDDALEVQAFADCVTRFMEFREPLHPHPGFGRMDHDGFNRFHAAHASHHLAFLQPS